MECARFSKLDLLSAMSDWGNHPDEHLGDTCECFSLSDCSQFLRGRMSDTLRSGRRQLVLWKMWLYVYLDRERKVVFCR